MLTMRIIPKMRERPPARRKSSAPYEIPLNAWVIQNSIGDLPPTPPAPPPPPTGGSGGQEAEVRRVISETPSTPLHLTGPRPLGHLAPARADRLELAPPQGAGPEQRRVLLP